MNPLVKEYLAKKFDLGDYTDENRQELANQDLSTQDRIGASLAALGAGIQGQNASAAGGAVLDRLQKQKQSELETFDKGRASKIQDYGLNRQVTEDMANDSFDSPEAETYRGIAKKFAPSLDTSKMSVKQIKELLPSSQALADMELKKRELAAKQGSMGGGIEGFKALDKDYAKDFNDWTSTGKAAVQKNLDRLIQAKADLQANADSWNPLEGSLSGRVTGNIPDILRSEKSRTVRDDVMAAAQGALRATLGSQFTEKEGQDIMRRSYDETLSPAENIKKIDAALKELETARKNQDAKAEYFQKYGSLRGFANERNPSASSVKMKAPDGSIRLIPSDQVEAAKRSGGVVIDG